MQWRLRRVAKARRSGLVSDVGEGTLLDAASGTIDSDFWQTTNNGSNLTLADSMKILLILVLSAFAISGCAIGKYPVGFSAPPAGSDFAKIELNWSGDDVRKVLGEPDLANAFIAGKTWIPFYEGKGMARTDFHYDGQGLIIFSRDRDTGALKVIRVLYNDN